MRCPIRTRAALGAATFYTTIGTAYGLLTSLMSSPSCLPFYTKTERHDGRYGKSLKRCSSSSRTEGVSGSMATSRSNEGRNGTSPADTISSGFGSRASRRRKGGAKRRKAGGEEVPVVVLKRSSQWACVKGCGACCYLAPNERPDLPDYLPDPKELSLYMSMAGEDGWCTHFDKENRACTIYEDRPRFCRVEAETFGDMYGVEPEDMDEFCSSCCDEQIGDVYGGESKEMRVFKAALAALASGERPIPESSPFGGVAEAGVGQIRDWGIPETSADTQP